MSQKTPKKEISNINHERLYRQPIRKIKEVDYKPYKAPLRIRFKVKAKRYTSVAKKVIKLFIRHPRQTITLITTFMKIKGNQTSTKAGIAFLVTILGFLGINVNPEYFSEHAYTLIESLFAVVGSATALYAIFNDEEKEKEE